LIIKDGAELRGRLQALGILRPSGHEHFAGSLVVPVLDERADGGAVAPPDDQVALPMAGAVTDKDATGPAGDAGRRDGEAPATLIGTTPSLAHRPAGA